MVASIANWIYLYIASAKTADILTLAVNSCFINRLEVAGKFWFSALTGLYTFMEQYKHAFSVEKIVNKIKRRRPDAR